MVAALGGPFEFDNLEDPTIKELLEITDYGHSADWGYKFLWTQKYVNVNANEVIYHNEILQMITVSSVLSNVLTSATRCIRNVAFL